MADLGGIPSSVFGELKGVVTDAGKGVISAGKDVAKGTAETLAGVVGPQASSSQSGGEEKGQTGTDPLAATKAANKLRARERLAAVREELANYHEQMKRERHHEEAVAEETKVGELEQKEAKKKQEERQVLARLGSQYGGTGETVKGGH